MAATPGPASDSAVRDGGGGTIKASHTPGPWKWDREAFSGAVPLHTLRGPTVLCRWWEMTPDCNNPADAVLIAAAPDMLAALKAVVDADRQQPFSFPTMPCVKQAIAAIALATGRKPATAPVTHGTETCADEAGKPA